jgi:hypothetical protein
MVGKVPIKEKGDAICILALCKSFAFAQARHKQSHALTYYYAPSYNYTPFTFKANKGCVTLWPFHLR